MMETETKEPVKVMATVKNGQFVVHVTDKGNGIAEEDRPKIFEKQFTRYGSSRGNGLGLLAAKQMINVHHGGEVFFKSAPGKTVFGFSVPLVRQPNP